MTQTEMVFKNGNLSFVFVLFEEQTQQKTSFWCCFYLICCLFFSFLFCLQCRAVPAEYIWGKHWVLLFLQLQGRLSDVYPALTDLGQAAGMAASALNLNGLGVMNRSVLDFQFCTWFKLLKPHYHIWMCINKNPNTISCAVCSSNQFHRQPGSASTTSAARPGPVGCSTLPVPDRSTYTPLQCGGLYSPTSPKVTHTLPVRTYLRAPKFHQIELNNFSYVSTLTCFNFKWPWNSVFPDFKRWIQSNILMIESYLILS